ncbi:MAG TPA: hypothetical protein VHU40_22915 [Polyangia bacterium]|nr:hypothetical protein [Polyangia bacterium]
MRTLEARFYPRAKAGGRFVTIGRVVCADGSVAIHPDNVSDRSVSPFPLADLQTKLQFFVDSMAAGRADDLLTMKSDFWSFIELS